TTAHLTCVTDLRLHKMVKRFGRDCAGAVWEAGLAAVDQMVANIQTEGIACDFQWVPGYLFAAIDDRSGNKNADTESLKRDARLANRMGFSAEYRDAIPFFASPGIELASQARFHPLKYLRRLLQAIPGNGSYVFERTEAEEFPEKPLSVK